MPITVIPGPADADIAILWTSADLLARCKRHARRPTVDLAMTDANWYAFLTEAQVEVYDDLFSRFPELGYLEPRIMTTDDAGLTYTFGFDLSSEYISPAGHATLYPNLRSIPDDPLIEGHDYLMEGNRVRMLAHRARTFSAGPYWRGVLSPDVPISSTREPLLYPKPHRMLLVWKALESYAARPGSATDQTYYASKYEQAKMRAWIALATSYNRNAGSGSRWWSVADLGANGLNV